MFSKRRDSGSSSRDGQDPASLKVTASTEFEGRLCLFHNDQGGRHTPAFNHYRPAFRFDASMVAGTITLPQGTAMLIPGDDWTEVTVQLDQPAPMEADMHFSLHEGDRTVGTGQVTRILR
jgi:elongation factor Tu